MSVAFPPINGPELQTRVQDVIRASFKLCQSAADVAKAIGAIFTTTTPGATTLTLGAAAPDKVFQTTPTHWPTFTMPNGDVVITAAWRIR